MAQTVFNQMQYKKTANRVGIFDISSLVTHFCYVHNLRRFAGDDRL